MKRWVQRLTAKLVDAGELEKTREELTRTKRQLRDTRERLRKIARDYLLLKMPRESVCAEIGVDEGDFSQQILQTIKPEKLYLISPWRHQEEYQKVRDRFARNIDEGRVEIRQLSSDEAASRFEDERLDWLYLDGNHRYELVKRDLELFYPKVRPGGYLCGDGYGVEGRWQGGVRKAVDEFVKETGLGLEVRATQFMVRKPELSMQTRHGAYGSRLGSLPDVLVIGTQKGGTTSLYDGVLRKHSYFEAATEKEIHYFDTPKFKKGEEWYRSNFPPPAWKDGRKVLTGEASPYYIFHPHVARRVAETVPDARLIVMLRNPVDRAFSDYQDRVRQGMEDLGFEEAIEAEEIRVRAEKEKILADENYVSRSYRRHAYLSRGVYVDQLVEWHRYFARDQLLILKSENFFDAPEATAKLVFEFLDLPEQDIKLEKTLNKGTYAPMNQGTRQRLETYFKPHNGKLYEYLDRDFGW